MVLMVIDAVLLSSTAVNALVVPPVPSMTTRVHQLRAASERRSKAVSTSSWSSSSMSLLMSADGDPNPVFPTAFHQAPATSRTTPSPWKPPSSSPNEVEQSFGQQPEDQQQQRQQQEGQANTRFSVYAPQDSENLSPSEFRARLKENMKADLEERRRKDPPRGNQPAKSYLDSL
mmetsp:Transcript_46877/g.114337  ORF Transcript_46877/g.114337 Transcript_46877/m.114337 type:complete len:174 (-) Transcript_46877:1814-2335(-)